MQAPVKPKQTRAGFDTIFVAIGPKDADRIERLTEEVIEHAAPADAQVILGHVFTREEYENRREALHFDQDSEVTPDVVARRYASIREMGDALEAAGLDYEVCGALGDSGSSISDLAARADADLIIVGGRKRSPTGKVVFGSTVQEVMLSAHCPVTFVRSDSR